MDKNIETMWKTLLSYIFDEETIENLKNMTQEERDKFLKEYFGVNNGEN